MPVTDFKKRVEAEARKIRSSEDLPERDKELLLNLKRDLKIDGLSDAWVVKLLVHLRVMAGQLEVSLDGAEKEDLKDLVEWVQNRNLAEETKRDYREVLKRFYKWLNGGEHPERSAWISTTRKKRNDKLPKKILTEDDVKRLIRGARNPRDRALIALLWETGARMGELIDLEVGDFEDRENGKKVVITGKTGPRRLPLISSLPHLHNWIENHPNGEDPEAPLWVKFNGSEAGEKLSYRYIRKSLKKAGERAGMDKPTNPHHFRHSRATYLANRFTEAQMCEWFGWVQGSDRPATYVHLSGRDVDIAYDQLHGKQKTEETERAKLTPVDCPRCGDPNDPDASYCQKCGMALKPEVVKDLEREAETLGEDFSKLARKEPELLDEMGDMMEMVKLFRENKDLLREFREIAE